MSRFIFSQMNDAKSSIRITNNGLKDLVCDKMCLINWKK